MKHLVIWACFLATTALLLWVGREWQRRDTEQQELRQAVEQLQRALDSRPQLNER